MSYISGNDSCYVAQDNQYDFHAVLEEPRTKRPPQPVPISGTELAALMKVGTRVVRGLDWKWGDQVRLIIIFVAF